MYNETFQKVKTIARHYFVNVINMVPLENFKIENHHK